MTQACPNIGPKGRRRRKLKGIVPLAASIILAAAVVATEARLGLQLALFPLFLVTGAYFFQVKEHT